MNPHAKTPNVLFSSFLSTTKMTSSNAAPELCRRSRVRRFFRVFRKTPKPATTDSITPPASIPPPVVNPVVSTEPSKLRGLSVRPPVVYQAKSKSTHVTTSVNTTVPKGSNVRPSDTTTAYVERRQRSSKASWSCCARSRKDPKPRESRNGALFTFRTRDKSSETEAVKTPKAFERLSTWSCCARARPRHEGPVKHKDPVVKTRSSWFCCARVRHCQEDKKAKETDAKPRKKWLCCFRARNKKLKEGETKKIRSCWSCCARARHRQPERVKVDLHDVREVFHALFWITFGIPIMIFQVFSAFLFIPLAILSTLSSIVYGISFLVVTGYMVMAVIASVLFPPVGVFIQTGASKHFAANLFLTVFSVVLCRAITEQVPAFAIVPVFILGNLHALFFTLYENNGDFRKALRSLSTVTIEGRLH